MNHNTMKNTHLRGTTMDNESENEISLLSMLRGSATAETTATVDLEPLSHHTSHDLSYHDHHLSTAVTEAATSSSGNETNTRSSTTATSKTSVDSASSSNAGANSGQVSVSPNNKNKSNNKRKVKAARRKSSKKTRRTRTASTNTTIDSEDPMVDKNGKRIFKKESPHYRAFINMCKLKGWTEKLPLAKRDPDLADFLNVTGFSRAQVNRKFNEYVNSLWYEESGMKQERERMMKEALQGGNLQQMRPVEAKKLKARIKRAQIKKEKQRTGIAAEKDLQDNLTVAQFPPVHPTFSGLQGWQQQQQQLSSTNYDSTTTLSIPPPASPTKRTFSTFSEKSPLRTRQFYDVHSNLAPVAQTDHTLRLDRHPSWGRSSTMTLQPPSLMRIQTAEVDEMLKGSILAHPPVDPPPPAQVWDWPQQQQQQQYSSSSFPGNNSDMNNSCFGQPPVLGGVNYNMNGVSLEQAATGQSFSSSMMYGGDPLSLASQLPLVRQRRRNSLVNYLPILTTNFSAAFTGDSLHHKKGNGPWHSDAETGFLG